MLSKKQETLNQLIKSFSPILLSENEDRENVIKAFKEWLQQKIPSQYKEYAKMENFDKDKIITKFINELLKELEEKKETE